MENIGNRLYELRKKHQISQEELAEMLHVSRQSVSKWENNSAVPELGKLVQICEAFDLSLDELVRGKRPEAKAPALEEERWFGIRAEIFRRILGILAALASAAGGAAGIMEGIGQYVRTKKYLLEEWELVWTIPKYFADERYRWSAWQGILGVVFLVLAGYMVWDLCKGRKNRWIYAGAAAMALAGGRWIVREMLVNYGGEDSKRGVLEKLMNRLLYIPMSRAWMIGGMCLIALGILLAVWHWRREKLAFSSVSF